MIGIICWLVSDTTDSPPCFYKLKLLPVKQRQGQSCDPRNNS
jgi:hypothetical protein